MGVFGLFTMSQPVHLHVYNVMATNEYIGKLNEFTRDTLSSGGVFHAAVEAYGDCEWSFGMTGEGSGVYSSPPMGDQQHAYRETIEMGNTDMSQEDYRQLLAMMMHDWQGPDYNVLNRNCCSFSEAAGAKAREPDAKYNVSETAAKKAAEAKEAASKAASKLSEGFSKLF